MNLNYHWLPWEPISAGSSVSSPSPKERAGTVAQEGGPTHQPPKKQHFSLYMFPTHLWSWCPWFHLHDRKRSGWAIQRLASQNQRIPSWGVKGISPENQVNKYNSWFTTWTLAVVGVHFHPTLMNPFLPFLSWYQPILTWASVVRFFFYFQSSLNLKLMSNFTISSCLRSKPSILAPIARTLTTGSGDRWFASKLKELHLRLHVLPYLVHC